MPRYRHNTKKATTDGSSTQAVADVQDGSVEDAPDAIADCRVDIAQLETIVTALLNFGSHVAPYQAADHTDGEREVLGS